MSLLLCAHILHLKHITQVKLPIKHMVNLTEKKKKIYIIIDLQGASGPWLCVTVRNLCFNTVEGFCQLQLERVFRDHKDFLAHDDERLMSWFQFPRAILLELCAELGPIYRDRPRKKGTIPVTLQVLTTLRFLTIVGQVCDFITLIKPCDATVWDGIIGMTLG